MRVLDDDRDPRIDDLPVDADTHNDVDLERAGQHPWRDLREPQLGRPLTAPGRWDGQVDYGRRGNPYTIHGRPVIGTTERTR